MDPSYVVIDEFYDRPDQVRSFALTQSFEIEGQFPGWRSSPYFPERSDETVRRILCSLLSLDRKKVEIVDVGESGSFQISTSREQTWIHADPYAKWAGVCYLTPDPPVTSGTALYRHRSSKIRDCSSALKRFPNDQQFDVRTSKIDCLDASQWELVDSIGNVFNRLVLYKANLYHSAIEYFGHDLYDARLFQVFFFDLIKCNPRQPGECS
ncbi:hypothetical protein CT676_43110 [Bradyrhizobium sp. MOS001]|uniref:DUF6445 family protein n=1 Tax=Bradyrhizobium sp. MOS001 TaxID=2133948 RepID=UPI001075066A|nr:DUF6445 family protein [Bradyrhizobium sp. MOS001]TFW51795.1 hypothetical protein CT676_43110 [Bradyrhizobium sp. MOS001]